VIIVFLQCDHNKGSACDYKVITKAAVPCDYGQVTTLVAVIEIKDNEQ